MTYTIREASATDAPSILSLIQELAVYEKAPQEVINTAEKIAEEMNAEMPLFSCLLAEDEENNVVGFALWYFRYSTWKGRCLYLEDLYIQPAHRRFGLGKRFLKELGKEAQKHACDLLCWQVLDWNTPAIDFYKSFNTTLDEEWINCKIKPEELLKIFIKPRK